MFLTEDPPAVPRRGGRVTGKDDRSLVHAGQERPDHCRYGERHVGCAATQQQAQRLVPVTSSEVVYEPAFA
ncbi:hypothetical protein GCM10010517_73110 [Streptosporangium fragile]|uniref:Uncharacterized protein n=1 Tax=Streptosporangium fragile TaxID=46186 RepID=A0ABP6IRN5_9ACTN